MNRKARLEALLENLGLSVSNALEILQEKRNCAQYELFLKYFRTTPIDLIPAEDYFRIISGKNPDGTNYEETR